MKEDIENFTKEFAEKLSDKIRFKEKTNSQIVEIVRQSLISKMKKEGWVKLGEKEIPC